MVDPGGAQDGACYRLHTKILHLSDFYTSRLLIFTFEWISEAAGNRSTALTKRLLEL